MTFLKNNATLLVIAVFLGVIAIGAYYVVKGNSSDAVLASSSSLGGASGEDLLNDLNSLQTIKFNTSIFTEPAFTQLTDFHVDIPPQPIGNMNPFAPLP